MTDREKLIELKTPVGFVIDRQTIEESTALGREIMDRVCDCIRAELEAYLDADAKAAEGGREMIRFPKDCWNKNCPHFHYWDMSVDDLTCVCDKLKKQVDACDEDFSFLVCPEPPKE